MQIKGYPVRLPLDVAIVFSRQPGGLHGARQDRHAAERPHRLRNPHPLSREHRRRHRASPRRKRGPTRAWQRRSKIPHYIRQIVEQIAFSAREDKKVDKRSGVSQRLPISHHGACRLERRAARAAAWRRPGRAARRRYLRRSARASPAKSSSSTKARCAAPTPSSARSSAPPSPRSSTSTSPAPTRSRSSSGSTWAARCSSTTRNLPRPRSQSCKQIQGLIEKLSPLKINAKSEPETAVSAAEFLLEGMYAHKRISRTEERSFSAAREKIAQRRGRAYAEKMREREAERDDTPRIAPAAASTRGST